RASEPGSLAERFTAEQSREAGLAGPMATELKTGNAHQSLDEFGSGWQMDIDYVVDRWNRWSQGQGESIVRAWIRHGRLHPYWAHPEWVRSAAGRAAFRSNRVVIVFSRFGNIGLENASAADLRANQVLRVSVPYLE